MGGDFNCTVDFNKDRKSAEPHPPSTRELAAILESTDLVDTWRCMHPTTRQYTWSHRTSQRIVRARLDRLQNWDGLTDKVRGRLQSWRCLLSHLSFRGRVLVSNNLAASMLWHRLMCLDPPWGLVSEIQKTFLEFFWGGRHWLKPAVLYLLRDEGGQGLVDIASRLAAFRMMAV